jgi:hypothetical protein
LHGEGQPTTGLSLVASPQSFFRASADAGRDARLTALRDVGMLLLHLAALYDSLKLASGR